MKLPDPTPTYSALDQRLTRQLSERADVENLKANRDNYNSRFINPYIVLTAPNGTQYYLGVDNAGALTITAV